MHETISAYLLNGSLVTISTVTINGTTPCLADISEVLKGAKIKLRVTLLDHVR